MDLSQLPAYFQLERVVEGLSGLLRRLTGVTLEERPLGQGAVQPAGQRAVAAARADAAHALLNQLIREAHKNTLQDAEPTGFYTLGPSFPAASLTITACPSLPAATARRGLGAGRSQAGGSTRD